jgi:hypothetical protein
MSEQFAPWIARAAPVVSGAFDGLGSHLAIGPRNTGCQVCRRSNRTGCGSGIAGQPETYLHEY